MIYNPFSIEGKTVLITGASSGIGRSTAIECSKLGARLVVSGRNSDKLRETFSSLEGYGHNFLQADLSSKMGIQELIDFLPALDGIVHSAGFTKSIPFKFINEEDISEVMQVNFMAPTLITQALYRAKKINKKASIVFISSISGVYCSSIAGSIYSASKGAINGIVKAMAIEMSTQLIRVNTICPGVIETSIFEEGTLSKTQIVEDIQKYPLKRHGKPEEVAHAVIYLLSDAAEWITGSNLLIDGGYTLL